ncbi:MAG: 16S rRNA (uracil(1498)-N(3))-methyltransferase [Anaerovoracaceae bacterium]|nr:16S rRNA (uracil(1498)-N(3))-methyltransferase [Anaerovoracaceae bacterium]
MSRFFVDPSDVTERYIYLSDRGDLHHMKKVLRLSIGDELDVSDGTAWEYHVRIEALDEDEAKLQILDKQKFAREPRLQVTLFQGIPKAGKMEGIIQKSVELGVHAIVPVFMERTVVVDKGNFGKKQDRWQKISDEAVKQCKRGIIPEVGSAVKFSGMLDALPNYDLILFPYENEENQTIKDCLRQITCLPETVAIIIGPEGGFSDKEARMLDEAGAERVSLGKTILRTETAGPAALAMTMYELEL